MTINWRKSESTIRPQDVEISTDCVRLHKNIVEVPSEDEGPVYFRYDESVLSMSEYAQYLAEKNAANIDYLSMELEVDL